MSDLIERIRKQLFGNLVHYRQHCINETDDAKQVVKFIVDEQGPPIAWRWRYVYSSAKPGIWRVKQTEVVPFAGDSRLAGVEVQPLYGAVGA